MIIRKYTQNYWEKITSPVQEKRYTPANERAYLFALLDRLPRFGYSSTQLNLSEEDIFIAYKKYGITLEKSFTKVIQILPDNWRQNRSKRELRYQSHTFIKEHPKNIQDKISARAHLSQMFDLPF